MRFRTKEIPSIGTMEIFKNNTWKKLCTASWDGVESNLTCMEMGYNNGPIDTWYKGKNVSNTATHLNCASLTQTFTNKSQDKLQVCKGTLIYILLNSGTVSSTNYAYCLARALTVFSIFKTGFFIHITVKRPLILCSYFDSVVIIIFFIFSSGAFKWRRRGVWRKSGSILQWKVGKDLP